MNNDNVKTFSCEKVLEFAKEIKSGDCYKIILRKDINSYKEEFIYYPSILDISQNKWFESEENCLVLILDEKNIKTRTLDRFSKTKRSERVSLPTPTPLAKYIGNNSTVFKKWFSLFVKALYKDQICLIHAVYLDKI